MRYIYYFDKEITTETVQELIDILGSYESVDLYFTTPGGSMYAMNILLKAINQHPDIVIYLTDFIASAGTFLLINCEKEVYITEDLDWILFHMGDRGLDGQFKKSVINNEILYQQLKDVNEQMGDKYKKLGLNSKEIKRYYDGEDVVLYKKDFGRLKISKK